MTGDWRKLHNEELCDLCTLPNMTEVIKLRMMTWAHVTYMQSFSEEI